MWLEVGASQSLFNWKLRHIISFTTDRGTERALADCPDLLPEFFEALGVAYRMPRGNYAFPRAIWIPGFHHLLDGAIEAVLAQQ